MNKALVPLAPLAGNDAFGLMTTRKNSSGNAIGSRLSFVGGFPAGDVKKALKEADPTLKGKALTAKVNQIMRGDQQMAKVYADLLISNAYQTGFRPVVADLNKAQNKLKLTFEKVGEGAISKDDVTDNAARLLKNGELKVEELEALIKAAREAKADSKAINVASTSKQQ